MRWEEIWDCATRIRNLFLRKSIPFEIEEELKEIIEAQFKGKSVVVRSSAPDEDAASASFAGLHESYVNIKGAEKRWRRLRGFKELPKVVAGIPFTDGIEETTTDPVAA